MVVPDVLADIDFERRRPLVTKRAQIPVIDSAHAGWGKAEFRKKLGEWDGFGLLGIHVVVVK